MIRYRVAMSGDLWAIWRDDDGRSLDCGRFPRELAFAEARSLALREVGVANALGRPIDIDLRPLVVAPAPSRPPRDAGAGGAAAGETMPICRPGYQAGQAIPA